MSARETIWRVLRFVGATVGYGCLTLFVALISLQVYRWLRDGEWTHIGLTEALHTVLLRCCVRAADAGWLGSFVQWLDTPVHWLGLHKVLELTPASLGLFALSVLGNYLFIYSRESLEDMISGADARR